MPAENATRPVQLQVNTNGAWKTVLHFDYGWDYAAQQVRLAAQMLLQASPDASFRIATRESHPAVLLYLSKSTYGLWAEPKGAV